jgi:hypothetical protein
LDGRAIGEIKGLSGGICRAGFDEVGGNFVVCGSAIQLVSETTRTVIGGWPGHATPVVAVACRDGVVVTAASEDRFVSVWGSSSQTEPLASLVMDDQPEGVEIGHEFVCVWGAREVVVFRSGGDWGRVLVVRLSGRAKGAGKRALDADSDSLAGDGVLAAGFSKDRELTVIRGTPLRVHQATFQLDDASLRAAQRTGRSGEAIVDLAPLPANALLGGDNKPVPGQVPFVKEASNAQPERMLGASDMPLARAAGLAAVSKKDGKRGGAAVPELSFEEKMRELGIAEADAGAGAGAAGGAAGAGGGGGGGGGDKADKAERAAKGAGKKDAGGSSKPAPTADSLSPVLEQALHSGDNALLEYCLSVSDRKVIENTVARLPSRHVVPFLTSVVNRFESTPGRGANLSAWIRAILVHHTATLMASPGLVKSLTSLYQTVEQRLEVFQPLLRLSGRLDLLVQRIAVRASAGVDQASQGPIVFYRDGAEDQDQDEDESQDDDDEDDDDDDDGDDSQGDSDDMEM